MIAPASPSDPCPTDALDSVVEYHVDPKAQPGNVVPVLARMLIDLSRCRCAAESHNKTSGPSPAARFCDPISLNSVCQEEVT